MADSSNSQERTSQLSSQMDELNKKMDTLTAKIGQVEAHNATLVNQTQMVLAATNQTRATEIARQTVTNPSSFIAAEATNYLMKILEKQRNTKFRSWLATRGSKVVQQMIATYINQKIPQLTWYGTSVSATEGTQYHLITKTNFPVQINTGVPFVGTISLAKVILEVQSDVNTITNEMSNVKCNITSEQPNRDVVASLRDDLVETIRPHKTLWAILYPPAKGLSMLYQFLKRETRFSIPFLILLIITTLINPGTPPAVQIWRALRFPVTVVRVFGVSPQSLLFGVINGIIWGFGIWLIIRFNLIPGLGKVIKFISSNIVLPVVRGLRENMFLRIGSITGVVAIVALFVLWRIGFFAPPPPMQLTDVGLLNSSVGITYAAELKTTGGNPPYSWSVTAGALPEGLILDAATGIVSGSPTVEGNYSATMQIADSAKPSNVILTDCAVSVVPADAMYISNSSLPAGTRDMPYSAALEVRGGAAPYHWGVASGAFPPGLALNVNGAAAVVSGTPTAAGEYTAVVVLVDSANPRHSFSQSLKTIIK